MEKCLYLTIEEIELSIFFRFCEIKAFIIVLRFIYCSILQACSKMFETCFADFLCGEVQLF